ncbi:MAG: Fe-S cluster assembly protein IscX [Planctomycetota bacterium]
MSSSIGWQDLEDIGIELYEAHPAVDPLTVKFTELLEWVLAIAGFTGTRAESNEARLEAIQMAWLEEWKENQ